MHIHSLNGSIWKCVKQLKNSLYWSSLLLNLAINSLGSALANFWAVTRNNWKIDTFNNKLARIWSQQCNSWLSFISVSLLFFATHLPFSLFTHFPLPSMNWNEINKLQCYWKIADKTKLAMAKPTKYYAGGLTIFEESSTS